MGRFGVTSLPLFRVRSRAGLLAVAAVAATLSGCQNAAQVLQDNNEGGWFSKKMDLFSRPEWAASNDTKGVALGPSGPVDPNDLVGADGRCYSAAAPPPPPPPPPPVPAAPADREVGSVAGDLAGASMPAMPVVATPAEAPPDPNAPQIVGGIALGMTECDAVRRAGLPGNVAINAGERGERRVTLTYLTGTWPGIYQFSDGRLKEIDRAPAPPEPLKPVKPVKKQKAKKPVKPKTATNHTDTGYDRTWVQ